jgi:hypothetical protein
LRDGPGPWTVRARQNGGVDFAERAARNEEIFRGINQRIEQGAEAHHVESALPFHCECARRPCVDTIEMTALEYEQVVQQRYRFVVIPGHEDPRIERLVEEHPTFLVVEKIGEARIEIEREHPQEQHRPDV